MTKAEKSLRLKLAYEQVGKVHSALCTETHDIKITEELFQIIARLVILADEVKKGGAGK